MRLPCGVVNVVVDFNKFSYERRLVELSLELDEFKVDDKLLAEYKKYDGSIVSLYVFFSVSGVIYKFSIQADWIRELENEIDLMLEADEEAQYEKESTQFPNNEPQVDRIIEAVASNANYVKFSTYHQKINQLIEEELIKENIELTPYNLSYSKRVMKPRITEVFDKKYKKTAVRKLKDLIKEMIGLGESKISIMAKLEISENTFHKYK